MKEKTGISVRCISVQIFILLCAFLPAFGSPAHASAAPQKQPIIREPALNVEMLKIMPVLEGKIENKKLLEKSKEKIYVMNSHEVRLISALCEKITDDGQAVSSDIAFLLVTALIVLS